MYITMLSENKVLLRDTKLLAWEGGINFTFTEEENINDFLNRLKFVSDRINV